MAEPAYSIVMTTIDSQEEANSLAKGLIGARLAACVQLSTVVSHYLWAGEQTSTHEILLLIKTTTQRIPAVEEFVARNHSYATPELVAVPITAGLPAYLGWIDEMTT